MTAHRQPPTPAPTPRTAAASVGALRAVARRPGLWPEALRAAIATAPRRWWRRRPFLPTLDSRYLEWRVTTAYGTADVEPAPDDVAAYLRWRSRMRRG